jgi:anti-sigma B factor antagonist
VNAAPDVPPLVLVRTDAPGGHRIRVTGDVDLATHGQLAYVLHAAVRCHERVVVDLAGVGFLDAGGVGTLVGAQADARERGHTLTVDGATGPVRRLLDLVGVLPGLRDLDSAG